MGPWSPPQKSPNCRRRPPKAGRSHCTDRNSGYFVLKEVTKSLLPSDFSRKLAFRFTKCRLRGLGPLQSFISVNRVRVTARTRRYERFRCPNTALLKNNFLFFFLFYSLSILFYFIFAGFREWPQGPQFYKI